MPFRLPSFPSSSPCSGLIGLVVSGKLGTVLQYVVSLFLLVSAVKWVTGKNGPLDDGRTLTDRLFSFLRSTINPPLQRESHPGLSHQFDLDCLLSGTEDLVWDCPIPFRLSTNCSDKALPVLSPRGVLNLPCSVPTSIAENIPSPELPETQPPSQQSKHRS